MGVFLWVTQHAKIENKKTDWEINAYYILCYTQSIFLRRKEVRVEDSSST